MDRPLADNRPIGPFAQSSTPNGVSLVYTVDNVRDLPSSSQLENMLDERYEAERRDGRKEVVASAPDVSVIGSPRSGTRGIKVNTGVSIMNMEQFEAVKEVTTDMMREQGANIKRVAVAVSNP